VADWISLYPVSGRSMDSKAAYIWGEKLNVLHPSAA